MPDRRSELDRHCISNQTSERREVGVPVVFEEPIILWKRLEDSQFP